MRSYVGKNRRGGAGVASLGAVFILLTIFGVAGYVYLEYKKPSIDNLVGMMPADAQGIMVFRGLPKLAVDYKLWEVHKRLNDSNNAEYQQIQEKMAKFFDIPEGEESKGLLNTGIDLTKPMGFSGHFVDSTDPETFALVFYLPVTDEAKINTLMEKGTKEINVTVKKMEENGHTIYDLDDSFYTFHNDHMVLVGSGQRDNSKAMIDAILTGADKLTTTKWYGDSEDLRNEEWEVYMSVNFHLPEFVDDIYNQMMAQAAEAGTSPMTINQLGIEDLRSVSMILDIEADQVRGKTLGVNKDGAKRPLNYVLGDAQDQLAPSIPGNALMSYRLAFDAAKLLSYYKELLPEETEMAMAQVKEMGFDLELDLINHLGSPLSFAMMSEQSEETMGFGGALWFPLKNTDGFKTTLRRVIDMAEDVPIEKAEKHGVEWSTLTMEGPAVHWAVAQDHFIVALGNPLSENIANGLNQADGSFLDSIKPEVRNYASSDADAFMYLDVEAGIDFLQEQMAKDPDAQAAMKDAMPFLDSLGPLAAWNTATEHETTGEFVFYAAENHSFSDLLLKAVDALETIQNMN